MTIPKIRNRWRTHCYDNPEDPKQVENALKYVTDGKPALMIHCSLHTFRPSDEWTSCCGMRTRKHDPYQPFSTVKATPDHPILKSFPDNWKTAGDELYQTIKLGEGSTALLKATSPKDNREHVVCWVSTYGKGKVFGTTLGHDMKTAADPDYLKLLANGILWASDKLDKDGKPLAGYAGTGAQ